MRFLHFLFLALVLSPAIFCDPTMTARTVIRCRQVAIAAAPKHVWQEMQTAYTADLYTDLNSQYLTQVHLLTEGSESSVFTLANRPDALLLHPRYFSDAERVSKSYETAHTLWRNLKDTPAAPHVMEVMTLEKEMPGLYPHLIVRRAERGSLADVIKSGELKSLVGPKANPRLLLQELRGLAVALREMHKLDRIHGDIKSENIFVTKEGVLQIGDLGSVRPDYSVAGTMTPAYTETERLKGRPTRPSSDCFSLSRVAYELVLGQRLENISESSKIKMATTEDGRKFFTVTGSPKEIDPAVSEGLSRLVMQMERAQTMDDTIRLIDTTIKSYE